MNGYKQFFLNRNYHKLARNYPEKKILCQHCRRRWKNLKDLQDFASEASRSVFPQQSCDFRSKTLKNRPLRKFSKKVQKPRKTPKNRLPQQPEKQYHLLIKFYPNSYQILTKIHSSRIWVVYGQFMVSFWCCASRFLGWQTMTDGQKKIPCRAARDFSIKKIV